MYQARHPAAFINSIADEGTKAEAVEWLQRTWDDLCDRLPALTATEVTSSSMLALAEAHDGRANAYENAHREIRVALGLSEHDHHELVIDTIKANALKLDSFGPLKPPSEQAREVFAKVLENDPGADMKAIPNQWLL